MRSARLRATALALLTASGACSLRSLDHLRIEQNGAAAAAGTGLPAVGGSAGKASSGGAGGAPGGGDGGTGGSSGGSAGVSSGAGGTPGTSGTGGSGGMVGPVAGTAGSGGVVTGEAGETGEGGEGNGPSCVPGEPGCPPLPVTEIAYVLRPAHSPDKCIDISYFGVDNGAPAIQYWCFDQINQVFWAEDHGDGYVSFRNALSGKCLDVKEVSNKAGAVILQWMCTGTDNQLFLPVPVGDDLVKLVAKHSGLVIDVKGTASTAELEPIVQSVDDGSPDMTWTLEETEFGAHITLASDDETELLLRHDGVHILLEATAESSAEWKVVPGLANRRCVSLASRDDTNHYLRQSNFELSREVNDGSETFAHDATFCFRPAFVETSYVSRSLESEAQPGYYVTRSEGRVVLAPLEDSDAFHAAATWWLSQFWH